MANTSFGEKMISGQMVSLDDENLDKLDNMTNALKEVENKIKESVILEI